MSYASRLVAMSRGHVPTAPSRMVGEDAAPPAEEIIATAVHAPASVPTPAEARRSEPLAHEPLHAIPPVIPVRVAPAEQPPAVRRAVPALPAMHHHATVEHRTIIEGEPSTHLPLPAVAPPTPPPHVAIPAPAQWLTEDVQVADPLVDSAETDALRELMRSVRQWTSSAPTVIDHQVEAPPALASPASVAPPTAHQVSIGNVTITVEDAPTATSKRDAAPRASTSDRMARHHIRGQ